MANPHFTRLASRVTARANALKDDKDALAAMIADWKAGAVTMQAQAAQLSASAPAIPVGGAVSITIPQAEQLVVWIDQTIAWGGDLVSLANDIDWSGWLNWFITDINYMIVELQNLADWVSANAAAIDSFETVVNDVLVIIASASALLAIV